MRSRIVLVLLWLTLLSVVVTMVAGCGPRAQIPQVDAPLVARLPHRNALEINTCVEESTAYDSTLRLETTHWLASGLEQAARENSDPLTLVVGFADAQPLAPESTPLAVTLPATDAYPPDPTLEPMPTKTGQPWKDAGSERQAQDRNRAKQDAYNTAVQHVDEQVSAARALAREAGATLHTLQPPQNFVTDRASIWGCVALASKRFQTVAGDKVLVLATTADERSFADVSSLDGLQGVRVIALFFQCLRTASWCEWSKGTWQSVFASAHVASQTWLDPAQSRVTSPFVVFDPQRAHPGAS
jgi:hypothetical protein